ncbi:histidine phosphatase family protein [Salibacteraceae bacterium]|jgi:broad specificity phosphatase PhoE|nr:histidine phosphatase family protein [Flavobacteriales bacterium]MDB9701416.1 histidine phosphatase family protein [Salibacteraceae bacterium]
MKLIAIRHLITLWNQKGLLQGRTDIELSDDPQNQILIDKLRGKLVDFKFDKVIVSPMVRAVQTAEGLGYSDIEIEPLVSEISFGRFEGKPKKEMMDTLGDAWINTPKTTELGPELADLEERVKLFLAGLNGQTTLLISHGAYIRGLTSVVNLGSINQMNQMEFLNGELKEFDL